MGNSLCGGGGGGGESGAVPSGNSVEQLQVVREGSSTSAPAAAAAKSFTSRLHPSFGTAPSKSRLGAGSSFKGGNFDAGDGDGDGDADGGRGAAGDAAGSVGVHTSGRSKSSRGGGGMQRPDLGDLLPGSVPGTAPGTPTSVRLAPLTLSNLKDVSKITLATYRM